MTMQQQLRMSANIPRSTSEECLRSLLQHNVAVVRAILAWQ